jgi:putative transposase
MIDSMKAQYSITELCRTLGVSPSGYYRSIQEQKSKRHQENQKLLHQMTLIHSHRHTRCYGSPRMTRELQARGFFCSENRVARIMHKNGLCARPKRPFRPRTTQVNHAAFPSPNLLSKETKAQAPGQKIVSDITYIPTNEGWLYLAIVLDLYSRTLLGWSLSDSLESQLVIDALKRALNSGLVAPNAIFHSDRGSQYSAISTRSLLHHTGLRQSMSAKGYCYDNAFAESFFASLKAELSINSKPFSSKDSARIALFDYLETFYNRKRLHSALDFQTPYAFLNLYSKKNIYLLN